MKLNDYPKDFVKRTKELVSKHYECVETTSGLEVTFLINCLLGLVVAVVENGKAKGLVKDKDFLKGISKIGFLKKNTKENAEQTDLISKDKVEIEVWHKEYLDETYGWFLHKMRNAIAHQHVDSQNENEKWVGVRMWNETNAGVTDFEMELTNEELKDIAMGIAEDYLEQNKTKKST
jgi:hypothetical protein